MPASIQANETGRAARRSSLSTFAGLPRPVWLWCGALALLWVACLVPMAYWHYVQHRPYPWNFPFFPLFHLFDIWCLTPRFHHVHSRAFFSPDYGVLLEYPAPAGIFYVWEIAFGHEFITFFASAAAGLLVLGWCLRKHLTRAGLTTGTAVAFLLFTALFSFTLWYEAIQANIEIFLFFVIAGALIALLNERPYLAAVLIGIAASMKLFPFILLGLFVPRRQWRAIAVGIASSAVSLVAGLWMLCPDIHYAWQQMTHGLALQRDQITLYFDDRAIGFDHSIFAFLKLATEHQFNKVQPVHFPAAMFRAYFLTVALGGIVFWLVRIRKLPMLNQIACLTLCAILLPPTSYEYTLLHMYVPFFLLVLYAVTRVKAGEDVRFLTPAFLCFAILFGPVSEVIFMKVNVGAPTLKCGALLVLLYTFTTRPMPGIEAIWTGRRSHA